jgi:hypothetical protein
MHVQEPRAGQRSARSRAGAQSDTRARLPRDVLMKMLMADIALLDRLETMCRDGAPLDGGGPAQDRLAAAAAMARELSASKETLATALLSLSLEEAPRRSAS